MIIAMFKGRLAQMTGISSSTLARYLNSGMMYHKLVEKTSYGKSQKLLNPPQVRLIIEHFVFELEAERLGP